MINPVTVIVAAPFPPPTHGVSVVVQATADALSSRCRMVPADISPGRLTRGLGYHVRRLVRVAAASGKIASNMRGERHLYLAVAGGMGNVYSLVLAGAGRSLGYRLFLDHHNFSYLDKPSRLLSILCRVAGRSSVRAVLSPEMGRRLSALYRGGGDTIMVVSNAARIRAQELPPPSHTGPLTIGHLSNLTWEKGLGTVLELSKRAAVEGLNVRVDLAGPASGSERAAIEAAISERPAHIAWRGPLYGQDKIAFMRGLDVFCFPTEYRNEAQPLVLFEALACGAPVIAFGRGCIREDITSEMGIVVPVGEDFVAIALPLIRDWAVNRAEVETRRNQAWQAYRAAHNRAREGLERWIDILSTSAKQ